MQEESILIVDDIEINRDTLAARFDDDYNIIEASDGVEAVSIIESDSSIIAVLLDLIMPNMNGLEVLKRIKELNLIKKFPVFIVTAEEDASVLKEAYELGAADIIQKASLLFVRRRVENTIELYKQRNNLEEVIQAKVRQIRYINRRTVQELASIVEDRSPDSGKHIKRVCDYTEALCLAINEHYPEYYFPVEQIQKIVYGAILHDVGKIYISDLILNKPKSKGRLTKEEFEIMKTHTTKGIDVINRMKDFLDTEIFRYSYDIILHHHERYDGKGYPDRLKGDQIPLWAQIVSVADVFDALTSDRCYKDAIPPQDAIRMILNGECGSFNPKLLVVLASIADHMEFLSSSRNLL